MAFTSRVPRYRSPAPLDFSFLSDIGGAIGEKRQDDQALAALEKVLGQPGSDRQTPTLSGLDALAPRAPEAPQAAADPVNSRVDQAFAVGDTPENYFQAIRMAESGGNDTARNPASSATGRYQFTEGTWNDLAARYPDLGLTPDGRTDPAQQERAIRAFTRDNAQALMERRIPPTGGNLYAAHFLGAGAAPGVLSGEDNSPVSAYVAPEVVQANPFLADMSVGDFKRWAASKAGMGGGQAPGGQQQAMSTFSGLAQQGGGSQVDTATLQALLRSPMTRGVGQALLKERLTGQSAGFRLQRLQDGTVLSINQATGEPSVLIEGNDPPDLPSSVREFQYGQQNPEFFNYQRGLKTAGADRSLGSIPPGYRVQYDQAGNPVQMVPVPGSPAAQEAQQAERAAQSKQQTTERYGNVVLEDIDRALKIINKSPRTTTGVGGLVTSNLPGTSGYGLSKLIDTVKANAGFDRLQAMRDASPTGGALGQVSERELTFLQSAIGNLEQSQSQEQLVYNLQRVRSIYDEIINGPPEMRQQQGAQASEGTTQSGVRWSIED